MIMKKVLIFALAAFAFVGCKKDEDKGPELYTVGVVGGTADKQSAEAGATVTLTVATLDAGTEFVEWESDQVETFTENEQTGKFSFVMPAQNVTVTAVTNQIPYAVTVTDGEATVGGVVVGTATVNTVVKLAYTGTPAELKAFDSWTPTPSTLVLTPVEGGFEFTMPAEAVSFEPVFVDVYTVTMKATDGSASVTEALAGAKVVLTPKAERPGTVVFTTTPEAAVTTGENNTFEFTMPEGNVTVNAKWTYGAEPYILYVADAGVLTLGNYKNADGSAGPVTHDNQGLTRPGALFVVKKTPAGGDGVKLFAPVGTTFNASPKAAIDPSTIPTEEHSGYISSPAFHNEENLAAGKGDICMLVGLTEAQAKAKIADGTLSQYVSGFRLPTMAELLAMGYKSDVAATGAASVRNLIVDGNVAMTLPNTGQIAGTTSLVNTMVNGGLNYLSSTPISILNVGALSVGAMAAAGTAGTQVSAANHTGNGVRCVQI